MCGTNLHNPQDTMTVRYILSLPEQTLMFSMIGTVCLVPSGLRGSRVIFSIAIHILLEVRFSLRRYSPYLLYLVQGSFWDCGGKFLHRHPSTRCAAAALWLIDFLVMVVCFSHTAARLVGFWFF